MNAFPFVSNPLSSIPARSPSSPSGKGSNALKAEARDAGPSGPYRLINCAQPAVRSAPNQDRRSARFIGGFGKNARRITVAGPEAWRKPCTVNSHTCPVQFTDNIVRVGVNYKFNCRRFSLTEPPTRCFSARSLRQIEYGQLWRSLSYFRGRAARP